MGRGAGRGRRLTNYYVGTNCYKDTAHRILPTFDNNLKQSVLVAQLYPALCNSMDWSLPGSSVHGILQARILEWEIFTDKFKCNKIYARLQY